MSNNRHNQNEPLVIRETAASDAAALLALAQRDSREVPDGRMLVAEVAGVMRAAVAIDSGHTIADPFQPTIEFVTLLRARARQLRGVRHGPLRIAARTRFAGAQVRRLA